ncbi:hypothetical protein AgCh_038639 [Apium graveolens]
MESKKEPNSCSSDNKDDLLHGNNYRGSSSYRHDRWQNNRGGASVPSNPAGPYRPRNYNNPTHFVNNERFVSEFRFSNSQNTLPTNCIASEEPCEIGCYSRVEGGEVYFDDRSLRLFRPLTTKDIGADLNDGFDTFTEKKDLGSQGFGALLACIRHKNVPLEDMHFVILATAYIRKYPWEMGVHKRNGILYLDVHKLPEKPKSELDTRRCYWGYCFEGLATEGPRRAVGEGIHHIDCNVEYCSAVKRKLGAHNILMGAEIDCYESSDEGRRDDGGRLVRTERLRTKDIAERVKTKGYWQGEVCPAFADEVLGWLYRTVKESKIINSVQ